MQVDMADEGEDKAAGTTPPASSEQAATPSPRREQSEWTASDTRGPLNSADRAAAVDHETTPVEEPEAEPDYRPTSHDEAVPHAAVAEPATEDSAAATPQGSEHKSLPIVPIVLALIIGALIGGGSSALVSILNSGGSDSSQVASLAARVDALEKRPDAKAEVEAQKGQAATPQAPAFDPAPLEQKIAGLKSDLDALKQKGAGDPQIDSKVAALGGSVYALKAQGAGVKDLDGKVTALAATLDGLKKEDATTESSLAALQDGQKSLEAKVTSAPALAVVADSLVTAIAHGTPYASEVAALGSLGADPAKIAVLKENADKGVPSAKALEQSFKPLADKIIAASNKVPPNASLMDRLKSGMSSMVSVRSAGASDGDDVGSRVSRIETDLAHDDVAGAYATWDGLPADAKAKSDAWGALAKTHVEAADAAHGLQQQAIASLSGKKS